MTVPVGSGLVSDGLHLQEAVSFGLIAQVGPDDAVRMEEARRTHPRQVLVNVRYSGSEKREKKREKRWKDYEATSFH